MRCFVYKSLPKADTYLYLARRDDFACVPAAVRRGLGALGFVLELELTPERRLARTDPEILRRNLAAQGFHLQFPPPPDAGPHAVA